MRNMSLEELVDAQMKY